MKHILFLLFGIVLLTQLSIAQDSLAQTTHTVVTANGTETVSAEQQNKDLKERLQKMNQDKQDERDAKRTEKYTYKFIGKIVIGVVIIGAVALWQSRKKRSN